MLGDFITRMLDPAEPEIAARAEIAMMNQTQRDTIQGLYDALAARLAHLLETGHREGVLRACDIEVNARVILSLVTWAPLARPWAHAIGPMGAERLRAAVKTTVFDGFSTQLQLPDYQPLDLPSSRRKWSAPSIATPPGSQARSIAASGLASLQSKGIDATSLEEIAAQLGTTKRTFHLTSAASRTWCPLLRARVPHFSIHQGSHARVFGLAPGRLGLLDGRLGARLSE